jgi:hypothetical protein
MRVAIALTVIAFMGLAGLAHARDQVPAELRDKPWTGVVPVCEDPAVLGDIIQAFTKKEADYWNSPLTIQAFDKIYQIGVRPWGLDYIPRRFCAAKALVSDGQWHSVYYSVREDLGRIGLTWDVNWCVTGFDRNLAYAPNCQMARP